MTCCMLFKFIYITNLLKLQGVQPKYTESITKKKHTHRGRSRTRKKCKKSIELEISKKVLTEIHSERDLSQK